MSCEFDEAVQEAIEQAHHRINTAVDRGENYSEIEEALIMMEGVVGELRSALEEAHQLQEEVRERAESVRELLDPDLDEAAEPDSYEGDGPLEEQFENEQFAMDGDVSNMSADEIL